MAPTAPQPGGGPAATVGGRLAVDAAQAAVAAAACHARKLRIRVCAAAVDADGALLAFVRMDGTPQHLAAAAIEKAYVAASVGMPTAEWDALLLADTTLRADLSARARMTVFGGGLPMHHRRRRVGAVGIAGGTPEQAAQCAHAALAAIGLSDLPG